MLDLNNLSGPGPSTLVPRRADGSTALTVLRAVAESERAAKIAADVSADRSAKRGGDGKRRAVEPPKLSEADAGFLEKVMRAMDEHCSEQALRSHFEAFAQIDADVAECAPTPRTRRGFLW